MPSTAEPPRLETERLVLRLAEPGDAAAIAAYFEENAARMAPYDPPRPADFATEAYWRQAAARHREEWALGLAMRLVLFAKPPLAPEGTVAGMASFTVIVRGPWHCCNLGYNLGGPFEGRGLMAEALRAALAHAFGPMNLHRIQANYMPTNERSGALLRRLGFVVEGYARDYLFINGAWRDHVLTALTNPDWRPPQP